MQVHIVMVGDYDDDMVDSVFLSEERANQRQAELRAADKKDVPCYYYVVTEQVQDAGAGHEMPDPRPVLITSRKELPRTGGKLDWEKRGG